jgi:hypothetical protein
MAAAPDPYFFLPGPTKSLEEVMRRTALVILAALFLSVVAAYGGDQPRMGPPPLRAEAPTLQPSRHHVWVPGFWKWASVNYVWAEGRWVKAKPNRAWAPGTWEQVGNHWAWKRGYWMKIETGKTEPGKKKRK